MQLDTTSAHDPLGAAPAMPFNPGRLNNEEYLMSDKFALDRRAFLSLMGVAAVATVGCSADDPAPATASSSTSAAASQAGSSSSSAAGTASAAPTSAASSAAAKLSGTLAFVYGAFAPQEKWEGYFGDFLKENPDVNIKYIPVALDKGWGPYTQKIAALTAGGQAIDVLWLATEGVAALADKGVLLNLDDLIKRDAAEPALADYLADVSPPLMQALQADGKQYLMPFAWNNIVTWYNPKVFAAAGVEAPAQTWNRDDYLALAKKLTAGGVYGTVADPGWFNTSAWVYAAGGSLLSEDLKTAQFDSQPVKDTLQFFYDLVYTHKVSPQPPAKTDVLFQAGKLAMFHAGRWPLQTYGPAKFTDFEITTLPAGTTSATVIGSDGYGVGAGSKNQDAAWALVKYLGSKPVMETLVAVTAASGSIPARKSLALSAAMAPPKNYELFYKSTTGGKPVPAGTHFPDVSAVFDRYMSKLMANETNVEAATKAMQAEATAILQRG